MRDNQPSDILEAVAPRHLPCLRLVRLKRLHARSHLPVEKAGATETVEASELADAQKCKRRKRKMKRGSYGQHSSVRLLAEKQATPPKSKVTPQGKVVPKQLEFSDPTKLTPKEGKIPKLSDPTKLTHQAKGFEGISERKLMLKVPAICLVMSFHRKPVVWMLSFDKN